MLLDWLHSNIPGLEILPNYLKQRTLRRWHWCDSSRNQLWCGWKIHASPSCGRLDFVDFQLTLNSERSTVSSLPALRRHEDPLRFPTYFQAFLTHPVAWKQNKADPSSWKHTRLSLTHEKMNKQIWFVPQLNGTLMPQTQMSTLDQSIKNKIYSYSTGVLNLPTAMTL